MHDLIDRQMAIDILDAYQVMLENGEENPYTWARFRMSELPAAQPEKCEECGNFNKARLLIPQPERTDCTECEEYDYKTKSCPYYCEVIRKTAEEVQPERKTGRWILSDTQRQEDVDNGNYQFICSECGKADIHSKAVVVSFCWNCGARMEDTNESD